MTSTHEKMERLREFGLSEYASRAYVTLLGLGTAEARDVSRLARIPLAKVYSTLEQLQERGLVTIIPESPKKYVPVPFVDYVDRLRMAREEEAQALAATREELAELFPIVGTTEIDDRGGVTSLRGRRNVVDKLRQIILGAREDVVLVLSAGGLLRHAPLRAAVGQARAQGATVRLLVPRQAHGEIMQPDLRAACELRLRPPCGGQAPHVSLVVADRRVAMMVHHVPDDASVHNGKDVGLLVDERALVEALESFVQVAWVGAAPVTGVAVGGAVT